MSKRKLSKNLSHVTVNRLPDGTAKIILEGDVAKSFIVAQYLIEQQLGRAVPPSEAFNLLVENMLSIAETGKPIL